MKYFLILITIFALASCTNFNDDNDAVVENVDEIVKDTTNPELIIPYNVGSFWVYTGDDTIVHLSDEGKFTTWRTKGWHSVSRMHYLFSKKYQDTTLLANGMRCSKFTKNYSNTGSFTFQADSASTRVFFMDIGDFTGKDSNADSIYSQTIYVKAGKASDCKVFVFKTEDGGSETFYLLKYVGVVKYELKDNLGRILRTYELIKYVR